MKVIIFLAAMLVAGPVAAQNVDCANADSQAEMNICADKAAKQADAKLNRVYAQVMSRLSPAGKIRLRDAQRAWLAFRDKECAFESNGSDGGSAAPMTKLNCVATLTDNRAKALAEFRTCEEGDLSCPS